MRRLVLLMVLLLATSAQAEILEFRYFSLDVPDGWIVSEDNAEVIITAEDKSGSLSLTTANPNGHSIAQLAEEFSHKLNGTAPEQDEEGAYTFQFNDGDSQAAIDGTEDLYMLIIGTGIEKNGETLGEMLESLEMK